MNLIALTVEFSWFIILCSTASVCLLFIPYPET